MFSFLFCPFGSFLCKFVYFFLCALLIHTFKAPAAKSTLRFPLYSVYICVLHIGKFIGQPMRRYKIYLHRLTQWAPTTLFIVCIDLFLHFFSPIDHVLLFHSIFFLFVFFFYFLHAFIWIFFYTKRFNRTCHLNNCRIIFNGRLNKTVLFIFIGISRLYF